MNSGSALIGAIIVLLCIIPFIIMKLKSTKRKKQLFLALTSSANQRNCKISKYDFFSDFVIGIDEENNVAFFYKKTKEGEVYERCVNLTDIKDCKVIKIKNVDTINRIELSFIPVAKNGLETIFEFFNIDTNVQPTGELQLIDKWSKLLNERIKK